jgi:hypothetical protein
VQTPEHKPRQASTAHLLKTPAQRPSGGSEATEDVAGVCCIDSKQRHGKSPAPSPTADVQSSDKTRPRPLQTPGTGSFIIDLQQLNAAGTDDCDDISALADR